MKKIILTLVFLISLIGYSQIPTKYLVNTGTLLDEQLGTGWRTGGGVSANTHAITQLSDLIGDQSAHANKIWEVQADIDLLQTNVTTVTAGSFSIGEEYLTATVGNTNFMSLGAYDNLVGTKFKATGVGTGTGTAKTGGIVLPEGVILTFKGGSLSNGIIRGNSTFIKHDELTQIFGTDVGFIGSFIFDSIQPNWFGASVSNVENITYFRKTFEFVRDNGGGNVHIKDIGIYDFSAYNPLSGDGNWYNGSGGYVGNAEGIINVYDNTHIKLFPQTTLRVVGAPAESTASKKCRLINFIRAKNSSLSGGGTLYGNKAITGNLDVHFAVNFYGDCEGVIVENLEILEFPADAFECEMVTNYFNGTPTSWISGDIDDSTGLPVVNATKSTSNNVPIGTAARSLGWTRISDQNSYMQWKARRGEVDIFFYDESDVFIYAIRNIKMYDKFTFPANAEYIKQVIDDPRGSGIGTDIAIDAKPIEMPSYVTIRNVRMHDLGRQGISITGAQFWTIEDNQCWNINGAPGYFIDIEDGNFGNRHFYIKNNTWWDVKGGIRIYSVFDCIIEGNKQKRGDGVWTGNEVDIYYPAVVGSDPCEGVIVKNNRFEDANIVSGVGYEFYSNTYVNSDIAIVAGLSHDNTYHNSNLRINNLAEFVPSDYWNYFVTMYNENLINTKFTVASNLSNGDKVTIRNIRMEGTNSTRIFEADNPDVVIDGFQIIDPVATNGYFFARNVKNLYCNKDLTISTGGGGEFNFDNWKIEGALTIKERTTNFDANTIVRFDNLQIIGNNTVTAAKPLLNINPTGTTTSGKLILRNSRITDKASTLTNWNLISGVGFENVRIFNSEFVTATAGNLINIGTGTEAANWYYKDNIFTTVILNNTTGTEEGNIEE